MDLKFWAADRKAWGWLGHVAETHVGLIEESGKCRATVTRRKAAEALAFSKD